MFKNLTIYRIVSGWTTDSNALNQVLESSRFVECGASQEKSVGWVEPRGHANGLMVEVVGGQWQLKLMTEVKVVPGSVVKRKVDEQLKHIEDTTSRKPGKKEKREIAEDVRLALLPMAFSKQASVKVWVNPSAGLLLTDASSQAKADEVMTWLIKAVDGLVVQLVSTQSSPSSAMSTWLSTKEAPVSFRVDRECELRASDESKAVVKYGRHALDIEEVSAHIAMGKVPTRLAMTWSDRVSFVLTDGFQLKKIAFLESVFEGATANPADGKDDNFDADVAIATGELGKLLPELIDALGGEVVPA